MIYRFDICARIRTLSEKILWNSNSELYTACDGVIHRVAKIHLMPIPLSFHSLITISVGNVSETLFVSRITFENVFVIFHRCHFLLDATSFFFLFFFLPSPTDSVQFSPTRCFLIERETRVVHPRLLLHLLGEI